MAEAAAVSGADLVLVCGGGGTAREVCAELAGTGIPVGIVPAGTGNLLARNLAIPLFLRSAIDVALNGQDRAIDLVEVSGDGFEDTHFMVMAGMGLDAAIMEGVNEDIKRRVGWIAYVLSGLKALMSPVVKVEIAVDGGEFTTYKAVTVVVGNVGFLQAGLPLLPDAAIDVALSGQDRAIDLVEVCGDGFEDTHFMVMAGMGFDAAIMEGVNEDIKKRVGWLAYVLSALKSLMFPAVRMEVSVDDGEFTKHRARTIVVGNVGFLQAGMPLLPDATIDDGVLDVVILHPRKFLSWIPLAVRVLAKSQTVDELIDRRTGSRVRIKAATDTPRQLDGDSIGEGRELRMECIHGRLLVRVPR